MARLLLAWFLGTSIWSGAAQAADVETLPAPARPPGQGVTSLARPDVHYSVPEKPYVVLRRDGVEAVVVDNRKVDDSVLPGHAAGYHGLAALRHLRQPRNLFVPAYAGLNFEHIH